MVNLPIPHVHETPDVQNNHPINLRAIRLMWPEKTCRIFRCNQSTISHLGLEASIWDQFVCYKHRLLEQKPKSKVQSSGHFFLFRLELRFLGRELLRTLGDFPPTKINFGFISQDSIQPFEWHPKPRRFAKLVANRHFPFPSVPFPKFETQKLRSGRPPSWGGGCQPVKVDGFSQGNKGETLQATNIQLAGG